MFVSANTTPFLAETFPYQDKHAVKHLVVVFRATYDVDEEGRCRPSEQQLPFVFADTHYGNPETTSVRVESDFVPVKPHPEVLLDAMAVAPGGRPAEKIEVGLFGPNIQKRAVVTGQRRWFRGGLGIQASAPTPFLTMPLAWHLTFGGWDRTDPDASRHRSDAVNPIGSGFLVGQGNLDGTLLPSLENPQSTMRIWNDRPVPIGFGPIPRFAKARAQYAGTYDKHWLENVMPYLPADFDDRYFQAASQDQWLPALSEGMMFGCMNMNETGRFKARVPPCSVPVRFIYDDRTVHGVAVPDTINLIPHQGKIVLVGRVSARLPRKAVRLQSVDVGPPRRVIDPNKTYYDGLGEAIADLAAARGRR